MGAWFALSSPCTDAQLVALCAVARARLGLYGEALDTLGELDGGDAQPELETHLERTARRLRDEWQLLVGIIVEIPAHHQAGMAAKARTLALLRDQVGYQPGSCVLVDLACSLVGDHHSAELSAGS